MASYDTDLLNTFIYAFFVLVGVSTLLAVTAVAWLLATRRPASSETSRPRGVRKHALGAGPAGLPQAG